MLFRHDVIDLERRFDPLHGEPAVFATESGSVLHEPFENLPDRGSYSAGIPQGFSCPCMKDGKKVAHEVVELAFFLFRRAEGAGLGFGRKFPHAFLVLGSEMKIQKAPGGGRAQVPVRSLQPA